MQWTHLNINRDQAHDLSCVTVIGSYAAQAFLPRAIAELLEHALQGPRDIAVVAMCQLSAIRKGIQLVGLQMCKLGRLSEVTLLAATLQQHTAPILYELLLPCTKCCNVVSLGPHPQDVENGCVDLLELFHSSLIEYHASQPACSTVPLFLCIWHTFPCYSASFCIA
jgi:hypothetical protein